MLFLELSKVSEYIFITFDRKCLLFFYLSKGFTSLKKYKMSQKRSNELDLFIGLKMTARTRPTFFDLVSNPPEPDRQNNRPDPTRPKNKSTSN